ncbi:MAG: hypothetical protein WC621_03460 [Patescibacteria group bacterium]
MLKENNYETHEKMMATTYIDLTRHGNRYGGPMEITFYDGSKIKFDDSTDLTEEGRKDAVNFGAEGIPPEVTLVHLRGGDEPRHGQTGDDIVKGSEKFGIHKEGEEPSPVRDKAGRVKGARRGQGVDYASSGLMPFLKPFKQMINDELNKIVSTLSPEEQEKLKTNPELRAKYREQAQVFGLKAAINDPKLAEIAAENEANELLHVVELSRRGVKAGEIKSIPIVGSGLFAESLLKHALVVEDLETANKKTGFESVDEIGGFTKQATSFRIKLMRDAELGDARNMEDFNKDTKVEYEFTDPERKKLFGGKKVSLDWNIVNELANKFRFKRQG